MVMVNRHVIEAVKEAGIPFYSTLDYKDIGLSGLSFPYKAAYANGFAHFHVRCERHGKKKGFANALCSPARFVQLFEYFACHTWKLAYGLSVADYTFKDRQSDSTGFGIMENPPAVVGIPWCGWGWLIAAFLCQILSRCTHDIHMRRHERAFWAPPLDIN